MSIPTDELAACAAIAEAGGDDPVLAFALRNEHDQRTQTPSNEDVTMVGSADLGIVSYFPS